MNNIVEYNELQNLSEDDLEKFINHAETALKEKKELKRKEVIAKIKKLAASIGCSVELHEKNEKSGNTVKKIMPKYCNPNNPNETWTGRGIAPKWMKELLNAGHEKSEFLINY